MTEEEYAAYISDDYDDFEDTAYEDDGGYNDSDRQLKEFLDDFWDDNTADDE